MSKLPSEEREILDAFGKGKLERPENAVSTQRRHQEYAAAMFKKDARTNIRLSSKDLRGLQKRALAEGFVYAAMTSPTIMTNNNHITFTM